MIYWRLRLFVQSLRRGSPPFMGRHCASNPIQIFFISIFIFLFCGMCRIGYHCYGVYLQACMGFIWSDCLDCVPVFLLISFWFLFVFMAGIWSVCCRVMGMVRHGERQKKKRDYCYYYFSLPCRALGLCAGRNGGGGDFCVRGMCGVRRQACAWGIVYCCLVFGVFCGLLARFLVSAGCLYVFPEKVS